MSFQDVIAEIRLAQPNAPLGLTAQRGGYYDEAVAINDYALNPAHNCPLRYSGTTRTGKTMWLYFGARSTIVCGTKEW